MLGHHVVQALDVLDVQRGVDVDAGGQQFLDIHVALGVAAAGRVGVRQLVDQHELRVARQDARRGPSPSSRATVVVDRRRGMTWQAGDQRLGFRASVGLDHADHDIDALAPRCAWAARAFRRSCRRRARRRGRSSARPRPPCAAMRSRASGDGRLSFCSPILPLRIADFGGRGVRGSWLSVRRQGVEREIELQHIDVRLADDAEQRGRRCCPPPVAARRSSGRLRALATRGTWNSAAAGVMSGSRPLAEVVTRSTGTGVLGFSAAASPSRPSPGRPAPWRSGRGWSRPSWRHCRAPGRSWSRRSGRCRWSRTAGRGNTCRRVKFWPISAEPTTLPSCSIRLPLACAGNSTARCR